MEFSLSYTDDNSSLLLSFNKHCFGIRCIQGFWKQVEIQNKVGWAVGIYATMSPHPSQGPLYQVKVELSKLTFKQISSQEKKKWWMMTIGILTIPLIHSWTGPIDIPAIPLWSGPAPTTLSRDIRVSNKSPSSKPGLQLNMLKKHWGDSFYYRCTPFSLCFTVSFFDTPHTHPLTSTPTPPSSSHFIRERMGGWGVGMMGTLIRRKEKKEEKQRRQRSEGLGDWL